jgi:hypothetical protein
MVTTVSSSNADYGGFVVKSCKYSLNLPLPYSQELVQTRGCYGRGRWPGGGRRRQAHLAMYISRDRFGKLIDLPSCALHAAPPSECHFGTKELQSGAHPSKTLRNSPDPLARDRSQSGKLVFSSGKEGLVTRLDFRNIRGGEEARKLKKNPLTYMSCRTFGIRIRQGICQDGRSGGIRA